MCIYIVYNKQINNVPLYSGVVNQIPALRCRNFQSFWAGEAAAAEGSQAGPQSTAVSSVWLSHAYFSICLGIGVSYNFWYNTYAIWEIRVGA